MPITQEDIDRIVAKLDAYYDDKALKSDNKVYLNPQNEKQRRRNTNAGTLAHEEIEQRRKMNQGLRLLGIHETEVEKGRSLVSDGIKSARCAEMQQVASGFCCDDEQLASKMVEMWKGSTAITNQGDHVFLAISDGYKLSNLRSLSINDLATLEKKAGVWVIDRFVKFGGPACDYDEAVMRKAREYDDPTFKDKGTVKVILGVGAVLKKDGNGNFYPWAENGKLSTAQEWASSIVAAPLSKSIQTKLPQRRLTLEGRSIREGGPSSQNVGQSQREGVADLGNRRQLSR